MRKREEGGGVLSRMVGGGSGFALIFRPHKTSIHVSI